MKLLSKNSFVSLAFTALVIVPRQAMSVDNPDQLSASKLVFGDEEASQEKNSAENLQKKKFGDKGILNEVREFFAHLENGPMKINAPGNYTKVVGDVTIKATAGVSTDTNYEKSLYVWVCKNSDDCTVAANFKPVLSADFTYTRPSPTEKPTHNKGHVFCDPMFISGRVMKDGDDDGKDRKPRDGAVELTFDLGTAGAQTVNAKAAFIPFGATLGTTIAASAKRSVVADVKTVSSAIVMSQAGVNRRFSSTMQRKRGGSALIGLELASAISCLTGIGPLNNSTAVAPTCTACFTRAATDGDGVAAPVLHSDGTATACASLTLIDSYDTMTNVAGYTAASIFPSGANGMPTVPSF